MLDSPTSSRRMVSGLAGCSARTGVADGDDDGHQSTPTLARHDSKARRSHAHPPPRRSSFLRLIAIVAALLFAVAVTRKVKPPRLPPPLPERDLYVSPIPESAVAAAAKAARDITDTAAATFGVAGAAAAGGAFEKRRQRSSRRDEEPSSSSSKLPIPRVGLPDPAKTENSDGLGEKRARASGKEEATETEEAFLKRVLLDDVDAVDVERLASLSSSSPDRFPPPHLAAKAVRSAAAHAWAGYVSNAWGEDELAPVSKEGYETFCSLAVTAVDALDTLWMMGFEREFERTRAWLLRELPGRLARSGGGGGGRVVAGDNGDGSEGSNSCVVSVFEATIRVVGGLASAADLTGDGGRGGGKLGTESASSSSSSSPVSSLGDLAALAAERLLPAFRVATSSSPGAARLSLPVSEVDLATGEPVAADVSAFGVDSGASGNALLAEAGSLAPEFWRAGYWRAFSEIEGGGGGGDGFGASARSISSAGASAVDAILRANDFRKHPLPPTTLRLDDATAAWTERRTVGGRTDSYYEYLLKMHLMLRREAERLLGEEEEGRGGGGGGGDDDGGKGASSSSSSSLSRRAEEEALSYITSEEGDEEEKHRHRRHHGNSHSDEDDPTKKRTTTRALALSRRSERYRQAWLAAVDEILRKLVKETPGGSKYLTSDMGEPVMEHLACFFPGNVALGVTSGVVAGGRGRERSATSSVGLRFSDFDLADLDDDGADGEPKRLFRSLDAETQRAVRKEKNLLDAASALAETCARAGETTAVGLAPEVFLFLSEIRPGHPFSLLRPEAAESFFYLWRATRDPRWRRHGWNLFSAIDRHARVEGGGGFSGVRDVTVGTAPSLDDSQPSWLLAETFKYLWLLFSDDEALDLSEFVLNTEAHPLRVFGGGEGGGRRGEEATASAAAAASSEQQRQQRRRREPKQDGSGSGGSRRHLKPT